MADTRRILLILAAVVVGLAVIGGLLAAAGAPDEAWFVFLMPLSLILNPFTLIVVLIVFLVRRNQGQQQQQQVVVHVARGGEGGSGSPAGPELRCPRCKNLNVAQARFCGGCGQSFQPKAS